MTPEDIAEYKQKWMELNNNPVEINAEDDVKGKDWCRKNLERYQWSFRSWTDTKLHTFYFEEKMSAEIFKKYMFS